MVTLRRSVRPGDQCDVIDSDRGSFVPDEAREVEEQIDRGSWGDVERSISKIVVCPKVPPLTTITEGAT
jgi:hypothetical protein